MIVPYYAQPVATPAHMSDVKQIHSRTRSSDPANMQLRNLDCHRSAGSGQAGPGRRPPAGVCYAFSERSLAPCQALPASPQPTGESPPGRKPSQ
ncbi:hypothetical protein FAIPA1_410016 [Frankia sp. AiPs1]